MAKTTTKTVTKTTTKTKKKVTASQAVDITVILDRSGSMGSTKQDAIGGFNEFVSTQKTQPGVAVLTLTQFDDQFQTDYTAVPIADVQPLNEFTYQPRGSTALHDAMGRTISTIEQRVNAIKKADRPNVVVLIITDGGENASREYNQRQVNDMISRLRNAGGYEFIFIGANQDAIATGATLGISAKNSLSYAANAIGTQNLFRSVSNNVSAYRSGGDATSLQFSDADRQTQVDLGAVASNVIAAQATKLTSRSKSA